jgi:anti-anti-sigma regulatory factor
MRQLRDIKTEQLSADAHVICSPASKTFPAPGSPGHRRDRTGGKEVVVDFSGTTFIDSTTLGVLVGGVKRLRTNDGQLSLVCSDRNITKIFEITGLDKVFTIYPTREEAVSAVGVPQG